MAFTPPVETFCARRFGVDSKGLPLAKKPDGDVSDMEWIRPGSAEDRQKIVARSRRPTSVPSFDATRVHLTRSWVVSCSILSPFIRVETAIRAGLPHQAEGGPESRRLPRPFGLALRVRLGLGAHRRFVIGGRRGSRVFEHRCDLGVPRCCGAFAPSTRLVSIRRGRGWFCFRF